MQSHYILADSSFFILFLNDINDHSSLNKVIEKYKFIITQRIKDEITQSYNNNKVWLDEKTKDGNIIVEQTDDESLEIFKPFISKEEELKQRGEYELIALAFKIKEEGHDFYLIIDDTDARKIASKLSLESYLVYTSKFIELCCCNIKIFTRDEAIKILENIRNSRFRLDTNILDSIINNIQRW